MKDTKRATGRTTRMILKAYDYVLKHDGARSVIVVGANVEHREYLYKLIKDIIPSDYIDNFRMVSYDMWLNRGQGHTEHTFVDHFCFEKEIDSLRGDIKTLQNRLTTMEKWSSLYDL